MKIGYCLFALIFFLSALLYAQPLPYLKVRLNETFTGETLLVKYKLNDFNCNKEQFLKLNHLNKITAKLELNKEYTLPIWLYVFNGRSIRSSVNSQDLLLAQTLQTYNAGLLHDGVRKQSYKQSGFIFVPYHFLNCKDEKAVAVKSIAPADLIAEETDKAPRKHSDKVHTFKIFGKKYQDVEIHDKKLAGKIFYVESGHGGPDPGAITKVEGRTLCEDEYSYDVSLRVARELIKHGATVFIINRDENDGIRDGKFLLCDSDELTYPNLKPPVNQKARLTQRSDAVNKLFDKYNKLGVTDQRLLVIHVDSRGKGDQTDTFLYYQEQNPKSFKIAKAMQDVLEKKYARYRDYNGTLTQRDLHMLRECKPATVYVELGNIRNEFDRKRIMEVNNRQAIASWLAEGFMK